MFKNLFWKFRYNKFLKKWAMVNQPYLQPGFLPELSTLVDGIGNAEMLEIYDQDTVIQSSYTTVVQWLSTAENAILRIEESRFKTVPPMTTVTVTLAEFLVTDDGYTVSYDSAVRAVGESLLRLEETISKAKYKASRDYYYRQLKELFETGVNFYRTVLFHKVND